MSNILEQISFYLHTQKEIIDEREIIKNDRFNR